MYESSRSWLILPALRVMCVSAQNPSSSVCSTPCAVMWIYCNLFSHFPLDGFCCFPGFLCVKLIWMEKDNVMCLPPNISKGWPQRQESDSQAVGHILSYCSRNWVETLGIQQINIDPTVTLPLKPWSSSFLNFWTVQTSCLSSVNEFEDFFPMCIQNSVLFFFFLTVFLFVFF